MAKTIDYGTGFLETYKQMLVFQPLVAGPHPVLLFVPGKQLYATGGIIGELGHAYKALCEHVASHGYVVAFVRVEQGLTDGDHARMAKDLLEAQAKLLSAVTTADSTRIAYAGHSTIVYIDGPHHEFPTRQARDEEQTSCVEDNGWSVIRFAAKDDWEAIIRRYPSIFGNHP